MVLAFASTERSTRTLGLRTDGRGSWRHGDGRALAELDGCLDIDIWPTPFTNSFPIRRAPMRIGERLYLFESTEGFRAELPVDEDGIGLDYPGLFRRAKERHLTPFAEKGS